MSAHAGLGLEVDVDTRLVELWEALWGSEAGEAMGEDVVLRGQVGHAIRVAYGIGYADALREDREGRRDELARAHGYQLR